MHACNILNWGERKMKCINKQTSHKTQIESIGDTFSTSDSLSHGQISNWKCHMQNASPWTQFQLSIVLLSSTSHKTDDVIDASIFLRFEITQTTAYDIQCTAVALNSDISTVIIVNKPIFSPFFLSNRFLPLNRVIQSQFDWYNAT